MDPDPLRVFHRRRQLLQIGGAGLLGLTAAGRIAADPPSLGSAASHPARAKAVIFLYQFGGPSHLDTFDLKPDAPDGIRGPYRPIATSVPGIQICERLPRMARVMNKVTLVRTLHHTMKNHNAAACYALTGREPPTDDIRLPDTLDLFPAYGSIVDRLMPPRAMPTFVAYPYTIRDGSVTPGQHASFLGKPHDPLLVLSDPNRDDFALPELKLPDDLTVDRLLRRRELQQFIDRQSRSMESSAVRGLEAYYESALDMLRSSRVSGAFDLSRESPKLRDQYGRHTFGQSCLLARRLVESGVRFINVYFSDSIGGQSTTVGGWDTHGFNNTRMFPIIEQRHLPMTDETLPTLLSDLDDRGLLDETLVVWVGEFGRTPRINENASRDHWPGCYTALLAGGGVKRGHVHGASDRTGSTPARDPVRPDDLAATMFHLLGIDPHTSIRDRFNRPFAASSGEAIQGAIA